MTNEKVIVAVGTTRNSHYHTNPQCSNLPEKNRRISRGKLPEHYEQCRVCENDINHPSSQRRGLRSLIESGEIDL